MIGTKIISFDHIDSTNNYMKKNQEKFDDGTIVIAKVQTHGRGRGNHVWESKQGNLYFSFVQKENISYNKIFSILTRVCITIVNVLKDYKISTQIKYPNDILVKNKKISGILIETYGNLGLDAIIVGVGLNINQVQFETTNEKATSVSLEKGITVDVNEMLTRFISEYNRLMHIDDLIIFDEYLRHSMVLGKGIDYKGKKFQINTISTSGELLLENGEESKRLSLNEISLEELYDE